MSGSRCLARISSSPSPPFVLGLVSLRSCKNVCWCVCLPLGWPGVCGLGFWGCGWPRLVWGCVACGGVGAFGSLSGGAGPLVALVAAPFSPGGWGVRPWGVGGWDCEGYMSCDAVPSRMKE
jgi:hypothetical protein